MVRLVAIRRVMACWVTRTTIVLARRPIDAAVVGCVSLPHGSVRSVDSGSVRACLQKPHPCRHGSRSTREVWSGLWPVLSRLGDAGQVRPSCGGARKGEACRGTKLVQARGRINAGGLGCIKARSGRVSFVTFCLDTVRRGRARLCKVRRCLESKPPRGWRGSGFDAGWWDASGCGQARQGTAGRVPSWCGYSALVIGTKPLRRGGAEWKGIRHDN